MVVIYYLAVSRSEYFLLLTHYLAGNYKTSTGNNFTIWFVPGEVDVTRTLFLVLQTRTRYPCLRDVAPQQPSGQYSN